MSDSLKTVPVVALKPFLYGDAWRVVDDAFSMDEENAVREEKKGFVSLTPSDLSTQGADYRNMVNHADSAYRQVARYRY